MMGYALIAWAVFAYVSATVAVEKYSESKHMDGAENFSDPLQYSDPEYRNSLERENAELKRENQKAALDRHNNLENNRNIGDEVVLAAEWEYVPETGPAQRSMKQFTVDQLIRRHDNLVRFIVKTHGIETLRYLDDPM